MARPKINPKFKKLPLNLTIRPSTLEIAKGIAFLNGVSMSELFEQLITREALNPK
tara:strand:+ start:356 stop:520 length:165 start_codon:yes stop_codon:yes gene_type:complete